MWVMDESCNLVINKAWEVDANLDPLFNLKGCLSKYSRELTNENKRKAKLKGAKSATKRHKILCKISRWRRKEEVL